MNTQIYNFLNDGGDHKGKRSSLDIVTLRDFLHEYGAELVNYYGEDFYIPGEEKWLSDGEMKTDTMILCMVDFCDDNSFITKKSVRRSLRRAGSERRKRIKHRYSYENPMNRIHGFVVLTKESIKKYPEKKVMSISTIATSIFSENRGIGSDMMDIVIHIAKECGYDDIILEAANDYASNAYESESEEEDSEEGDERWWDEEEDEEEDEGDEEEDEEDDEDEDIWEPTEEILEIISHELWRKTMRKPEGDTPYYNIGKDYIWDNVNSYLTCGIEEEEEGGKDILSEKEVILDFDGEEEEEEEEEEEYCLSEEPEDYEYGGYWYKEGKKSQKRLMEFYEKFGFIEDPDIYLNWGCYDEHPYPTMRLTVLS